MDKNITLPHEVQALLDLCDLTCKGCVHNRDFYGTRLCALHDRIAQRKCLDYSRLEKNDNSQSN